MFQCTSQVVQIWQPIISWRIDSSTLHILHTSPHALSLILNRHTLRKGDGGGKVAALLAFPDEGGGSGQGQDGMVVWAADQAIHMNLPSSKVCWIAAGFRPAFCLTVMQLSAQEFLSQLF
jgi:hypothetical protein